MDGFQKESHSAKKVEQIGDICDYNEYISELPMVWIEYQRVLVPNGKLVINATLMPMLKSQMNTHHNRHMYDLNAEIQHSILKHTKMYLMDTYIWNRTNPLKSFIFGSYPYPRNFYAQNTIEFITVYVKDRTPIKNVPLDIEEKSKLAQHGWIEFTKQIWNIPIPGKGDSVFEEHPAIMPEEIVYRCIRLFTYMGEVVLDPFAGSGTTLKVAKSLDRNFVGYEIMESYKKFIDNKINPDQCDICY